MNTPRTDAAWKAAWTNSFRVTYIDAESVRDLARQLETELATMTALADRLAEAVKACFNALERIGWPDEADTLRDALAAYEAHKKQTP